MRLTTVAAFALASLLSAVAGAQRQTPVTVEALLLAEDRRASLPGDYELLADAAGSHADPAMRARAVRALGRLEQSPAPLRQPADLIERAVGDPDPVVRRAAAYALAQSVNALDAAAKAPRRAALLARLAWEDDQAVAGALMESAARLADPASVAQVVAAVLAPAAVPARTDAQASALEILARRAGKPGVMPAQALDWLRLALFDESLSRPARRAALQALVTARAIDAPFAARAFDVDDWQVRRLVIVSAAAANPPANAAALISRGLRDPDAHVRDEAIRAYARRPAAAGSSASDRCAPILSAVKDVDAHVALAAFDALATCGTPESIEVLSSAAQSPGGMNWHRASHSLVSLASVDPIRARDLLPLHARDKGWPVRMYAATAAARLGDDSTLSMLAADEHPNVREAAIAGLAARASAGGLLDRAARQERLKQAVRLALKERRDPQLLRTAARAIAATGDPAVLKDALLDAIVAIDAAGGETTVDARVALIDALKLAAPDAVLPTQPRLRAPLTPAPWELQRLPSRARITMARGGVIELELLPDEAPATVARFARLARAGYYDGLTFHRVVPNFVVQGGSPWANEYSGAPRFQRDEVGFARHERGAVGISTRGRDTGDAQIFIDLVDLSRLNHDYTVFARVVSGMDVVDQILEADVITRIEVVLAR